MDKVIEIATHPIASTVYKLLAELLYITKFNVKWLCCWAFSLGWTIVGIVHYNTK